MWVRIYPDTLRGVWIGLDCLIANRLTRDLHVSVARLSNNQGNDSTIRRIHSKAQQGAWYGVLADHVAEASSNLDIPKSELIFLFLSRGIALCFHLLLSVSRAASGPLLNLPAIWPNGRREIGQINTKKSGPQYLRPVPNDLSWMPSRSYRAHPSGGCGPQNYRCGDVPFDPSPESAGSQQQSLGSAHSINIALNRTHTLSIAIWKPSVSEPASRVLPA
ncbi:hypothetical protein SCHPADRAFT_102219 [Schizopora paradoxa]|uniref:Uncharacterized protein n=1 Tax=Schizopora paradoxa TaxID=27342 RepID=A0A0H2S4E7_9AGAM|nr:hypothetical protein SCHPADRAFT_102219 [Schizopora paradoxa]